MALDLFRFFRCSCEMSGIGSEIDESAESRIWRDAYYTLESSCLPSGKVRQWLRFPQLDVGVAQGSHIYRSPKHSSARLASAGTAETYSVDFCLFMFDQRQREVCLGGSMERATKRWQGERG